MNDADGPADSPPQQDDGDRWMTLAELGQARGISKASAARLVRRRKWRRQADNQGRVRVLVPVDALSDEADIRRTDRLDIQPDMSRAITALQNANAGLVTRAERAEAEADRLRTRIDALAERAEHAEAEIDRERARTDRAEQGRDAERARADALRDKIEGLQAQVATADAEAETARTAAHEAVQTAEALRKAEAELRERGIWARLRAAWRGD